MRRARPPPLDPPMLLFISFCTSNLRNQGQDRIGTTQNENKIIKTKLK